MNGSAHISILKALVGTWVCLAGAGMPSAHPPMRVDFASGDVDFPAHVAADSSFVDTELATGSGLLLSGPDHGDWTSGAVPSHLVVQRMVLVNVDRANWIRSGGFDAFVPGDQPVSLSTGAASPATCAVDASHIPRVCSADADYYPPCDADGNAIVAGSWYSRDCPSKSPEANDAGEMHVYRRGSLRQYFPVDAGDSFTLTFELDIGEMAEATTSGNDAEFNIALTHLDQGLAPLSWGNPTLAPDSTGSYTEITELVTGRFGKHKTLDVESGEGLERRGYRLRIQDCAPLVIYEADSWIWDEKVERERCATDDFSAGGSIADKNALIEYAALEFRTNFQDDSGAFARIDNVELQLDAQVLTEIIDAASGDVIQASIVDDGFFVEPFDTGAHPQVRFRLTLRGPDWGTEWDSPRVGSLAVIDGTDLEIRVGERVTDLDFEFERLGFNSSIPPTSEWLGCYDADHGECDLDTATLSDLRTLCADPHGSPRPCLDYLTDHGIARWRNSVYDGDTVEATISSAGSMEFSLAHSGENEEQRLGEITDAGLRALQIITLAGNDFHDESSLTANEDHVAALEDFSTWLADRHGPYRPDTEVPPTEEFQVFVETDLGLDEPGWVDVSDWSEADQADLMNRVGAAVLDANPDADVHTSINPSCSLWPIEHMKAMWGELNPDAFTHFGFNTLDQSDSDECAMEIRPEDWRDRRSVLDELWSEIPWADEGWEDAWRDKPFAIGAYALQHDVYDPWCDQVLDNGRVDSSCVPDDGSSGSSCSIDETAYPEWERGWGMEAFAKRVARATLTNLSLPAEAIYYYGAFGNQAQSKSLNNDTFHACWHVQDNLGSYLFEADPGGVLDVDCTSLSECVPASCGDSCAETLLRPNDGGAAVLRIAGEISRSNPYASEVETLMREPVSDHERYHTGLYRNGDGDFVLAVWWFRNYEYNLRSGYWVNYLPEPAGAALGQSVIDVGFKDRRRHSLVVRDLVGAHVDSGDVLRITRIPLDGALNGAHDREIPYRITREEDGDVLTIPRVVVGERPILLRIEVAQ